LRPGFGTWSRISCARAQPRTSRSFAEFGFDHEVDRAVAAYDADIGRLWLIRASANRVREQEIVAGEVGYAPLSSG
jgi:hypothetical protein